MNRYEQGRASWLLPLRLQTTAETFGWERRF